MCGGKIVQSELENPSDRIVKNYSPRMLPPDAVIIGGGVAGLAAAVDLTKQGYRVLLVEQRPFIGGRTYSFQDPVTGDEVDNGQHLMMGCYHSTLRYLHLIGAEQTVTLQKNLQIVFKQGTRNSAFTALNLPAPFHVIGGLLNLRHLPLKNRIELLKVGLDLVFRNPETSRYLQSQTVAQWLEAKGQPGQNRKYLWDILAVGTLNDDTQKTNAALFVKVLQETFFGKSTNASILFPRAGLSTIFVAKAVEFLKGNGSEVLLNTGITGMSISKGRIDGIALSNGEHLSPTVVISAVPYFGLSKIFTPSQRREIGIERLLEQFESSPILTVHAWFDTHFMTEEFIALLDSPFHWIFNKSLLNRDRKSHVLYLSGIISAAHDFISLPKEKLLRLFCSELQKVYPAAGTLRPVHSLVIKEKRATFSPRVGLKRPGNRTRLSNLFLAGDWTDTSLPATIEGAIKSGFTCANLAVHGFPLQGLMSDRSDV
jgi:zeta-carotene desaturase